MIHVNCHTSQYTTTIEVHSHALKRKYEVKKYVTGCELKQLASKIGLTEAQVNGTVSMWCGTGCSIVLGQCGPVLKLLKKKLYFAKIPLVTVYPLISWKVIHHFNTTNTDWIFTTDSMRGDMWVGNVRCPCTPSMGTANVASTEKDSRLWAAKLGLLLMTGSTVSNH